MDNIEVTSDEVCDRLSATNFEPPMGKKKNLGSTLPVKFKLFYETGLGPEEVTSQEQLNTILTGNGMDLASPLIHIYDVTEIADELGFELPEDAQDILADDSQDFEFRYEDGHWIHNLRLDSLWFDRGGTYWVEISIGDCILEPGNQLFQTK